MSYKDGWAALHLQMPAKIPRTEYSVLQHWPLISAVAGRKVDALSPAPAREAAQKAFLKAWDVSFWWNTWLDSGNYFKGRTTDMGHANYQAGGTDFRDTLRCPFKTVEDVLAFDPVAEYGIPDRGAIVRSMNQRYREACDFYGDMVNMSGMYFTMFSGLIHIFGWEMMLLAGGEDPAGFGRVARRYERWMTHFYEALALCEAPVIMSHDDIVWTSGPVFHPDWYREFIFPAYKRMWRPLLDAGKRLVFTADGTYTMFFDDVVAAGAHGLVMEPTNDMALFARQYGRTHAFIGNADTRILLSGTRDQIRAEVKRCMDIGRHCLGFFLAVGNHIPANTPVENAQFYNEVYEELATR